MDTIEPASAESQREMESFLREETLGYLGLSRDGLLAVEIRIREMTGRRQTGAGRTQSRQVFGRP